MNQETIYHITHIQNLPGIVKNGAMIAQSLIQQCKVNYCSIAHHSIQERRSATPVPCGPKGNLHDYVPFYFAPSSPMLYAISRGYVEGYKDGQEPIIYLMASIKQIEVSDLPYVFTDGHGIMSLTEYFDHLDNLDEIDWNVMNSKYWFDTDEDPDRKRRRQAEFLIFHRFPWHLVQKIGVMNETKRAEVEEIISVSTYRPPVICMRSWYY